MFSLLSLVVSQTLDLPRFSSAVLNVVKLYPIELCPEVYRNTVIPCLPPSHGGHHYRVCKHHSAPTNQRATGSTPKVLVQDKSLIMTNTLLDQTPARLL